MHSITKTIAAFLVLTSCAATTSAHAYSAAGKASYYGGSGRTASGGHVGHMTAAHRSLPFGTRVRVTNLHNHRSAIVTVNDRGPFVRGRIIDVSAGAASALAMRGAGVAPVRIEVVSASMDSRMSVERVALAASPKTSSKTVPNASNASPATSSFGAGDAIW